MVRIMPFQGSQVTLQTSFGKNTDPIQTSFYRKYRPFTDPKLKKYRVFFQISGFLFSKGSLEHPPSLGFDRYGHTDTRVGQLRVNCIAIQ